MAKLKDKDFEKQFEELRSWIRSTVTSFSNDTDEIRDERIKKAESDKQFFAKTYFPHYVDDEFAPMHDEMFKLADITNEPVAIAGFRGCGKSVIITFLDELHKTIFKKNKFTLIISDTEESAAAEYIMPILAELEENQRLKSDFGEFKTNYWSFTDAILKSGKRILALGPKMGAKGKKFKNWRPDRIIVEDFENRNSSKKKSIIKRRLKWLLTDVMRGVNPKNWQFIFIGNYFSKKTIIHFLLTAEEYKHWHRRIYPALLEFGDKFLSPWELRFPKKKLLEDQRENPQEFRTEMMQKPEDQEAVFNEEWFQFYNYNDIADLNLPVITYKDPSAKKGEEHCYKAIIVLAVDMSSLTYYVLFAWIKKTSKWNCINAHFDLSEKYRSSCDGIEANGFQSSLREDYELVEVKRGKRLNIKLINNQLPKETRISKLSSPIERGFIKFIRNHSDQDLLIEQLQDFPDGDFIDGGDALAGAVELADTVVLKKRNKVKAKCL